MARLPRKRVKFVVPDQWAQESPYAGTPKWDVSVIMVANEKGYDKYCKLQHLDCPADFQRELADALRNACPDV